MEPTKDKVVGNLFKDLYIGPTEDRVVGNLFKDLYIGPTEDRVVGNLIKDLYIGLTEDRVVGNLLNFVMKLPPTVVTPQVLVKRNTKSSSTTVSRNQDIREMFAAPKEENTKCYCSG